MKRIYSIRAIVWLTFLGFPLAGFLAIGSNFKTFGKKNFALGIVAVGILVTMVTYLAYARLPEEMAVSSIVYLFLLYFLFAVATGFFALKSQGNHIEQYLQKGGTTKGFLRGIGLLIVSFVFTLIMITLVFALFPSLLPPDFSY